MSGLNNIELKDPVHITDHAIREKIKGTSIFKKFETFKQGLVLRPQSVTNLKDLYRRAKNFGINELAKNPLILKSDFNLIDEILKNE